MKLAFVYTIVGSKYSTIVWSKYTNDVP